MIIQCNECKAKFKLDDSKVKPEGVKVKCKKCGNVFSVFPEKEEEKGQEIIFDINQQAGLTETIPPVQKENEDWEKDIFAEKPSFEEKEEIKEQQDFDWGQFSSELKIEKSEPEQQTTSSIEAEMKFEFEESLQEGEKEEIKEELKEDLFTNEDQTDIFETQKFEFGTIEDKKEEQKFDFDFYEQDKKEEAFGQEPEQNILSDTGSEFTFEEKKEDELKQEERSGFIFEEPTDKKIEKELELEGVKETPKTYEDEEKVEETVIGQDIPLQPEDFLAQAPKKINFWGLLISLLIVIIIGGGGTGYMWWHKVKITESRGSIGITNVKSKYGEAKEPTQIFVVTGKIKNEFNVPKSFLKVKCTVYGKNNVKLIEKVVFAGNIFTDAELKELTYSEIEKGLNNKMGKSMVNVDVPPGKLLDFMIVFDKLPEGAEFIEVEGV